MLDTSVIQQRTEEWHLARLGHVTASRLNDLRAKIKSGEAASRRNYRMELICERLTGRREESFTNAAMQWGTDHEPAARMAYELTTENWVEEVGFCRHASILWFGASPDGLVVGSGLVEIKCPHTATHIDYLLSGKPPEKYINQMMAQMACTGRDWCDFVSYDPRLPEDLQLFIVRLERDDKFIAEMEADVQAFLAEVEETIEALKNSRK